MSNKRIKGRTYNRAPLEQRLVDEARAEAKRQFIPVHQRGDFIQRWIAQHQFGRMLRAEGALDKLVLNG